MLNGLHEEMLALMKFYAPAKYGKLPLSRVSGPSGLEHRIQIVVVKSWECWFESQS